MKFFHFTDVSSSAWALFCLGFYLLKFACHHFSPSLNGTFSSSGGFLPNAAAKQYYTRKIRLFKFWRVKNGTTDA